MGLRLYLIIGAVFAFSATASAFDPNKDYYAVLGVKSTASLQEIRSAYRKLARATHPDTHPGRKDLEEKFKTISEAYAVVGEEKERAKYDRVRRGGWEPFAPDTASAPAERPHVPRTEGEIRAIFDREVSTMRGPWDFGAALSRASEPFRLDSLAGRMTPKEWGAIERVRWELLAKYSDQYLETTANAQELIRYIELIRFYTGNPLWERDRRRWAQKALARLCEDSFQQQVEQGEFRKLFFEWRSDFAFAEGTSLAPRYGPIARWVQSRMEFLDRLALTQRNPLDAKRVLDARDSLSRSYRRYRAREGVARVPEIPGPGPFPLLSCLVRKLAAGFRK